MELPIAEKYKNNEPLTAREYLKTLWFRDPEKIKEEDVIEAMECYHKYQSTAIKKEKNSNYYKHHKKPLTYRDLIYFIKNLTETELDQNVFVRVDVCNEWDYNITIANCLIKASDSCYIDGSGALISGQEINTEKIKPEGLQKYYDNGQVIISDKFNLP